MLDMERGLGHLLRFVGLVALVAGASTVLLGAEALVGAGRVAPTVDSEMRFYAVWYAAAGVALLRAARAPESYKGAVRSAALIFFVAGCARALSWWMEGEPHLFTKILMVIELLLAPVMVAWLRAVAGSSEASPVHDQT